MKTSHRKKKKNKIKNELKNVLFIAETALYSARRTLEAVRPQTDFVTDTIAEINTTLIDLSRITAIIREKEMSGY